MVCLSVKQYVHVEFYYTCTCIYKAHVHYLLLCVAGKLLLMKEFRLLLERELHGEKNFAYQATGIDTGLKVGRRRNILRGSVAVRVACVIGSL